MGFTSFTCISNASVSPPSLWGPRGSASELFPSQALDVAISMSHLQSCGGPLVLCCLLPNRTSSVDDEEENHTAPFLSLYFSHHHVRLAGHVGLCRGWGQLKEISSQGGVTLRLYFNSIQSHNGLYKNAYSRFICNKQTLEITQMFINRQMDKQTGLTIRWGRGRGGKSY